MIDVVVGLIFKGSKIYICQRSGGEFDGKWEFPGGKLEVGESESDALVRELNEELGCDVNVERLFLISEYKYQSGLSVKLHTFECSIKSGEIESVVHSNEKFVDINNLKDYDFVEGDYEIINKLMLVKGLIEK